MPFLQQIGFSVLAVAVFQILIYRQISIANLYLLLKFLILDTLILHNI
jgi:hypothetical protein